MERLTKVASNQYMYKTEGVCAKRIAIVIDPENQIVEKIVFDGGCHGNGTAVGSLCEGMKLEDVINKLQNISCRSSKIGSSCGDQLANALIAIKNI